MFADWSLLIHGSVLLLRYAPSRAVTELSDRSQAGTGCSETKLKGTELGQRRQQASQACRWYSSRFSRFLSE
ncbi:hypothetical protein K438DRAFT_1859062 [Mycena galopus ATCC 62051]|nr:hypothetical protein K438DRAFT_1859062 [Mycena galopus ATCC 62051]